MASQSRGCWRGERQQRGRRRRRWGTGGLEVVLEADGSGYVDLLVDSKLGEEAKDGAAVLRTVRGVDEGGL
ncbi:hypothetical protein TIFTF001_006449 [Ficus carica]|uniref:Uncharacterized protein n=1 Tax=Ficus carica TaxID=3494 RepID=A0AA88DFP8_FICCA|nr:hypothetical protein TIFTF001_006449 [Ficus carica]